MARLMVAALMLVAAVGPAAAFHPTVSPVTSRRVTSSPWVQQPLTVLEAQGRKRAIAKRVLLWPLRKLGIVGDSKKAKIDKYVAKVNADVATIAKAREERLKAELDAIQSKPPFSTKAEEAPAAEAPAAAADAAEEVKPAAAPATKWSAEGSGFYTPTPKRVAIVDRFEENDEGMLVGPACDLETGVGCSVSELRAARASGFYEGPKKTAPSTVSPPAVGPACDLETGVGCSVSEIRAARASGFYEGPRK